MGIYYTLQDLYLYSVVQCLQDVEYGSFTKEPQQKQGLQNAQINIDSQITPLGLRLSSCVCNGLYWSVETNGCEQCEAYVDEKVPSQVQSFSTTWKRVKSERKRRVGHNHNTKLNGSRCHGNWERCEGRGLVLLFNVLESLSPWNVWIWGKIWSRKQLTKWVWCSHCQKLCTVSCCHLSLIN